MTILKNFKKAASYKKKEKRTSNKTKGLAEDQESSSNSKLTNFQEKKEDYQSEKLVVKTLSVDTLAVETPALEEKKIKVVPTANISDLKKIAVSPKRNARLPEKVIIPAVTNKQQEKIKIIEPSSKKKRRNSQSNSMALDDYVDEYTLSTINKMSSLGITCTQYFEGVPPLFYIFCQIINVFFETIPNMTVAPPGGDLELITILVIYYFITIYGEIDLKIPATGRLEIVYRDLNEHLIKVSITTAQFKEFLRLANEKNSAFNLRDMCSSIAPRLTAFAFVIQLPSSYSVKLIRLYDDKYDFTEEEVCLLYSFQTGNNWLLKDYRRIYDLLNFDKKVTLRNRANNKNPLSALAETVEETQKKN